MTIFLRLQLKALMLEAGRTLKGEYLSSMFKTSGLNSSATKLKTKFKKKYIRKKQIFFFFFDFQDRVLLCSLGFPGTCSVNQAGLKLRELPAAAYPVLACITTTLQKQILSNCVPTANFIRVNTIFKIK